MIDAQKPDHISLSTLVTRLREGQYVIPDFQREFEWNPWDISELLRSIFLDYYIGSLLLWSGTKENYQALSCETIYGYQGAGRPGYIVLDGQQRLTAMYYAFVSPNVPLPNRSNKYYYFVRIDRFMAEAYDEAFGYDWSKRWVRLVSDRDAQYAEHLFPMAVLGAGGWELPNWVQGYEQHWRRRSAEGRDAGETIEAELAEQHADNAKEFGEHLKDLTEQYQVSYIELNQQIAIEKVCDIFTQINSRGVQLDTFDLINALLKPKGIQLKQMWREARPRLEFVEGKMNVYILQVMSILRQGYCSPKYLYYLLPGQERTLREPDKTLRKEVLVPDVDDFCRRWHQAVGALESAMGLLRHPQEFGAISSSYLPYVSILPAFAAIQEHIRSLPANRRLDAQRKCRHWYWASVFLNRYSGAVESTTARDFLDLKAWIEDDAAEPGMVQELRLRFRSLDLRKEQKRGTSVYNGIFNLFVLQGARDWMSGTVPQHGDLDDHHIIPASKASELGLGATVHTILNRTPLTAETNRHVIRNRYPSEYLPDLIAENGEGAVRAVLESHFISPGALAILLRAPFKPQDFEDFLAERQRTLMEAIDNLLIKDRLNLSPSLRELDQRIESVELALRANLLAMLDADPAKLPSHVAQKVNERVQGQIRRNPAADPEDYKRLDKLLESFDLRELQDTIQNKLLWPQFEPRFANKEAMATKFGQLAELRNGIRHSRTVDEITRKEGEAAILWFEQVLRR